jgi:hypothetical protein
MAVLATSGRTAMASAILAKTLHLAWGSGLADWDSTPVAESIDATALTTEIGRALAAVKGYAAPIEPEAPFQEGEFSTPTGRWIESVEPTNNLYLRFDFGYDDAPDATLREAGLFSDTVVVGGLPEGQRYFEPDEVSDPGILIAIEHFPALQRQALVRQSFEFVLVI